jgi:hypothetical protein
MSAEKLFFSKKKHKKTNDKKQSTSLQRVGTLQWWCSTCTQQIQNWFLGKFAAIARNKKTKIFFFQGTICRWVCSLSRYLLLSQFKKSLDCAAPRGIPVTETEEKLAAYDPRILVRR